MILIRLLLSMEDVMSLLAYTHRNVGMLKVISLAAFDSPSDFMLICYHNQHSFHTQVTFKKCIVEQTKNHNHKD